jgi:hypothetical protein
MNKFYKKYLNLYFGVIIPIVILNLGSFVIFVANPKLFYFRPWEYFDEVGYQFKAYDASWAGKETPDLSRNNFFYYQDAHVTKLTVDRDGFRTNYKKARQYPILVSGDSTIFGSGLSDTETLPWKLSEMLDIPVFNGGRSSLFNTLKRKELSNVAIVIDCRKERLIKGDVFDDYGYKKGDDYSPLMKKNKGIKDIIKVIPGKRYWATAIFFRTIKRIKNDLVIYLTGKEEKIRLRHFTMTEKNLDDAVRSIVKRKEELTDLGKRYIFVAIPEKQTVYEDRVDKFTRNYITTLTRRLLDNGVETINLLDAFSENRDKPLFHPYDTHWNSKGTAIAAREIARYLDRSKRTIRNCT